MKEIWSGAKPEGECQTVFYCCQGCPSCPINAIQTGNFSNLDSNEEIQNQLILVLVNSTEGL